MSNFHNNTNKQDFANKLEVLRDLESEKPVEEIDVSLIKACVELILEYNDETVNFTPEEIEEKVRKIPFVEETTTLNTPQKSVKGRSTKVKSRKILLIAAIISILVAIFALTSIAFEWNIFDELKERFGTVANTPVNEEIDVGGISIVHNGEFHSYDTLEEALQKEKISVLYPTKLPDDITINQIIIDKENSKKRIVFAFNDSDFSYSVVLNETLPQEMLTEDTEKIEINNIECYITDMPDIGMTQIFFEYNGNLYCLRYNDKQGLIGVIENLKESK